MNRFFIGLGPFIKVHILFFPILAASLFGNYFESFIAAYVSAFIHESGHIITAKLLNIKISHIEILPFGICGKLKDNLIKNPDKEIIIAISGPFISFFLALLIYISKSYIPSEIYSCIFPLNILLGIVNLIPVIPLDGGRILKARLIKSLGIISALKISLFISYIFTAIIILISIYGILVCSFNFSLILVSSFLLGNLCIEQKSVSKTVVSEMLGYKEKLTKNSFNKACVITAFSSIPARKILKKLSYDRYYIIHILDKNFKIKKTVTEGQIIEALTEKGVKIRLDEI